MVKFKFKAFNSDNTIFEGEREATSRQDVIAALKAEGATVISVEDVSSGKKSGFASLMKGKEKSQKIRAQDIAIFCRQLATLINAGVNILDAIDDISEMTSNPSFSRVLKSVVSDIREGYTLSDSLKKHPKVFTRVLTSMVAVGEKAGKLGKVLDDLATYMENSVKLKRKIKSASVYPIFVFSFFTIVFLILVLVIIPKFEEMFRSFGAELPLPTKIVMGVSNFFISHILIIILFVGILFVAFMFIKKTALGRRYLDSFKLNVPIFGKIYTKVIFARFFQTLSTLIKSGVEIVASLEIATNVLDNVIVEGYLLNIKNNLITGSVISHEMAAYPIFPKMIVRMTAVGEKSGQLDEMFSKVSDYYSDEVDAAVVGLASIVEPILIVMLGFIVGVAVIALYLPIFNLALAMMQGMG